MDEGKRFVDVRSSLWELRQEGRAEVIVRLHIAATLCELSS